MSNSPAFLTSLDDDDDESTQTTTPGHKSEIRWEIVARMPGLTPAIILAGRLQSEGIPARAWQEGAGQALGLTVGLLGTGYVAVPEEYVAQAQAILDDEEIAIGEEEWDEWDEEE